MTKEEEEGRAAQVFVLEMKICTGGRGGHVEDDIEELERWNVSVPRDPERRHGPDPPAEFSVRPF